MKSEQTIKAKRNALKHELRLTQVRFAKYVNSDTEGLDGLQQTISVLIGNIRLLDWILEN